MQLLQERRSSTSASADYQWMDFEDVKAHYKGCEDKARSAVSLAIAQGRVMQDPNLPGHKDAFLYHIHLRSQSRMEEQTVSAPGLTPLLHENGPCVKDFL